LVHGQPDEVTIQSLEIFAEALKSDELRCTYRGKIAGMTKKNKPSACIVSR
jgi:hypothetical protein